LAAASVALAAPPTYVISVDKTADPGSVPVTGGTVAFTVWVTGAGTGDLLTVAVTDDMVGCTLAGPFGDQPSGAGHGKLESGETWTYTCTVDNVMPGDTNTATANGCHDNSACASTHDTQDTGAVTLGEGETPPSQQPPSQAPPSEVPPSLTPSLDNGNASDAPGASEPTTDTELFGASVDGGGMGRTFMLLAVMCFLIASIIVLTPASAKRRD
jgi:hypothetical protein